jgi:glycyl-tRNA synthetase beta chain
MAELLVEFLCEEIPARMQARAASNLQRLVEQGLEDKRLQFESTDVYVTPRRLTLVVDGLPVRQPDAVEEKKGPKVGSPDKALQGFMKANGLNDISEAEVRETEKGSFYFLVRSIQGRDSRSVLPDVIIEAAGKFPWPKSMRWSHGSFRWVRPLHSVIALFDGDALEGGLDLGQDAGITFGVSTRGHRFLAPEPIHVTSFSDYREKLRSSKVILDAVERRRLILESAQQLAESEGFVLYEDEGLLEEVAGLIEWPIVLSGAIDKAFMDLPPEVLVTTLKAHQKYFSVLGKNGRPAPLFIFVANMEAMDGGKTIVAGNERVLSARLSDARFFWDQDRQIKLDARRAALRDIVFHAKLGTLADKVERIEALVSEITPFIPDCEEEAVLRAARLCKADLTSGMVGEFPELQGTMGGYYALHDGEPEEVAAAIKEHYAPQGPGDACPDAPLSVAVALSDKLDTLAGFWAIGEKPTGSKDPYSLRRAALGVIRLILENAIRLPLKQVIERALDAQSAACTVPPSAEVIADLMAFFADRLKVALKDKGVRHDHVAAVFALGGEDDLVRLMRRVDALSRFLEDEDGANLLVAHQRATNIVRIESKKDDRTYKAEVESELLGEAEEQELFRALKTAQGDVEAALAAEDFTTAMSVMAELRRPVDAFFDNVTVNSEDAALRANRLNLLSAIDSTLSRVADFSKIEG